MLKLIFDAAQTKIEGADNNLRNVIKQELTWKDKSVSYLIKQRGMSWLDDTRCCYNVYEDKFPTGLLPRVVDLLDSYKVEFDYECLYDVVKPTLWELPDWAFKHQREIVETALSYHRCLIQSPTASGKSWAAAFFVQQFPNERILITVPSLNLLANMTRTLEKTLEESIGQIGDGKSKWERVTVGIINSLARHAEGKFKGELDAQQVLIIDESHAGASKSYQTISDACPNTGYRLGLSATNWRTDGADLVLEGVTGPKVLTIPESVMVDLNVIHAPKAFFISLRHDEKLYNGHFVNKDDFGGRFISYPYLPNCKPDPDEVYMEAVVRNATRNKLAIDVLVNFLNSKGRGGNALVIIERIEHGLILKELAEKRGLDIQFIDGSTKGKKRMEILDAFRSGDLDCLIASSILNEGEDLPKLELVINCAGRSNERINTQRDGRVLRIDRSGTKKRSIIVDFYDVEEHYLETHSRKRMHILNKRYEDAAHICTLEEVYDYFNCDEAT
jgi:DNA excision repair protein ERCC-3